MPGIVTRDRPWEYIVHASAAGEGARFWRSIMAGPTNRGARNSLITCCDDLAGRPDAGQGAALGDQCAAGGLGRLAALLARGAPHWPGELGDWQPLVTGLALQRHADDVRPQFKSRT